MTGDNDQGLTKVKALETSVQPRFSEVSDDVISRAYLGIIQLGQAVDQFPPYGSPAREAALRRLIRNDIEPILTGAIGAMVARFVALGWSIHGGRNKAARARRMLADAEGGDGWSVFVSKLVEDMLVADRGGFMEMGTLGSSGPVVDIYNLDAACCGLTGNQAWPVVYMPKVGKKRRQRPLDRDHVVHLPNMPSPDETLFDRGLSPVSRALRAAQILRLVNEHDTEQLQNLPPQGLLTVMNITESQWLDALTKYKEGRKKAGMDVFPGLLVIAGQSITNPPGVQLTPFSTLPLGFNKRETVEIYVKTLALALGIDVAEIWLIPQVGATKAAFTVQHMKARGKGIGYIISAIERAMNFHVMPRGVVFEFDFQDDEQDAIQAEIEGKKILNVSRMYETRRADGVSLISREEGRQLLVQDGILSPVFAEADEVTLEDVATKTWEEFDLRTKSHYLGVAPPMEMPDELVRMDRKGRVVDLVLRPRWKAEQKQVSEVDEELLEELGEPLGEDEAVEEWEVTETDVRRNRRAWDGLLDRFRRQA